MFNIRKSFSAKLSLGLLLLAVPIFLLSLGVLFTQSRHMIRVAAVGRANSVLSVTTERIGRYLMTIETATNSSCWLVERSFEPDSILAFTNRIVRLNPHVDGCSVSAEPDMFPSEGRHFSAYTVREDDTITTVKEAEYEYFDRVWYKTPRELDGPCWVVSYDDADSLELTLDGMIASYGRPLYDKSHRLLGIISSDLSLLRLSKLMSEERPYPNSYFMMINEEGRYFIHPDSTRLFTQTIFSGADPRKQADIIALGHDMTAGNEGRMMLDIDGVPSLVCYQPVPGTTWSLAIVSPDSDVLAGYQRLTYIVIPLLVIGLLIIVLLCHQAVGHAIRPLDDLLKKTQTVASGNMEVYIARSTREDVIGQLQNSFAKMVQYLNFHMGSVRYSTGQMRLKNEELLSATRLAKEADRQKTAFIQNVSHQIRTPLNIIMGFAQVLNEMSLPDEEMKSITATMDHNSKLLNRLVLMLFDSSETGLSEELNAHKHDLVPCNDVAREAISYIGLYYPKISIELRSEVADDFYIQTSRLYLMRSLREILYNAAKYSDGEHVLLSVQRMDNCMRFVVEDTGTGIGEADRERMFDFFTKVDDLSEGLGLGLPLAKRHARNLGGDLTLDETYHDGCRFIIEIPIPTP
jgi:signal transduction histidine kinase